MIDLNHRSPEKKFIDYIDVALVKANGEQRARDYLGGSRLGHSCARALQYEYTNTPKDIGREFTGRALRIFEVGHVLEDVIANWIQMAGFNLRTAKPDGRQFGFSVAGGRIRGHVDGVFIEGGPKWLKVPALWECKTMKADKWRACQSKGVAVSHPIYAGQIAIYQAYMGLHENPAVFTAINKDTQELLFEMVPFDADLAQRLSDRGARIIQACEAGELLPRVAQSRDWFECRFCDYQDRCWQSV